LLCAPHRRQGYIPSPVPRQNGASPPPPSPAVLIPTTLSRFRSNRSRHPWDKPPHQASSNPIVPPAPNPSSFSLPLDLVPSPSPGPSNPSPLSHPRPLGRHDELSHPPGTHGLRTPPILPRSSRDNPGERTQRLAARLERHKPPRPRRRCHWN